MISYGIEGHAFVICCAYVGIAQGFILVEPEMGDDYDYLDDDDEYILYDEEYDGFDEDDWGDEDDGEDEE